MATKVFEVVLKNSLRVVYEADSHVVHTNPENGSLNYVSIIKDGDEIALIAGDDFSHINIKKQCP